MVIPCISDLISDSVASISLPMFLMWNYWISILGSIVTTSSFNLFTCPATSIWPCFSFLVLIIRKTAETNLYFAFWFASTFVVTKWMASQVPSSIPLFSNWARKNKALNFSLTFFYEPAGSKSIVISVKEKYWGQIIVIVVQLGISSKNVICFLLHFEKFVWRIHGLLFTLWHHNWWEVLVCPRTSVWISVFIIFAF